MMRVLRRFSGIRSEPSAVFARFTLFEKRILVSTNNRLIFLVAAYIVHDTYLVYDYICFFHCVNQYES